jgi:SAM-dependent methyltransferase
MPDLSTIPAFYSQPSLHLELYDEMAKNGWERESGDTRFFLDLFKDAQGPLLELACGTGRVAVPLAEAGHIVYGIDNSPYMLERAQKKSEKGNCQEGLHLSLGDMKDFKLPLRFAGIYCTFHSFQILADPIEQENCLRCVHSHLEPNGVFSLNVFDPLYELVAAPKIVADEHKHPVTGNRVTVEADGRVCDYYHQRFSEIWRWTEFGPDGQTVVRQEQERVTLRWSFRPELVHLFRLSGFEVLAEYSDFFGAAPAYGRELVWVLRKRADSREGG